MSLNLSNPGRPIEAGVILMGETEILDVAPIDLLHGIGKKFVEALPLSDELKAKALDVNFHWITEKVSLPLPMDFAYAEHDLTLSRVTPRSLQRA
jgi:hypothetical protein